MEDAKVTLLDPKDEYVSKEVFIFDRCFWSLHGTEEYGGTGIPFAAQQDVYNAVGPEMLENVFAGFHAAIFAYGQTASGKTYTMMGQIDGDERGLIPRLCEQLFSEMKHRKGNFKAQASYYEIYNEKVWDLLQTCGPTQCRVRQHPISGPFVDGIRRVPVTDIATVLKVIRTGDQERTTSATAMNDRSSRSHAVFSIRVTQTDGQRSLTSTISMVDLAGSERASGSESKQHFKESTAINLSLTTLSRVIDALAHRSNGRNKKPPYRESLLTWVLSDALGGNSQTYLIATVSPAPMNYEETASTLRYSARMRSVLTSPRVNATVIRTAAPPLVVNQLRDEIQWLQAQLTTLRTDEKDMQIVSLEHRLKESENSLLSLKQQFQQFTQESNRSIASSASSQALRDLQDENQRLRRELMETRRLLGLESDGMPRWPSPPVQAPQPPTTPSYLLQPDLPSPKQAPPAVQPAVALVLPPPPTLPTPVPGPEPRRASVTPTVATVVRAQARHPETEQLSIPTVPLPSFLERAITPPATPHGRETFSYAPPSFTPPPTPNPPPPVRLHPSPTPAPPVPAARPYFGIEVDVSPSAAKSVGPVQVVAAFGPAATAGLMSGDFITRLKGRPISSLGQLKSLMAAIIPNEVVPISASRGGAPFETKLVVGTASAPTVTAPRRSSATPMGSSARTSQARVPSTPTAMTSPVVGTPPAYNAPMNSPCSSIPIARFTPDPLSPTARGVAAPFGGPYRRGSHTAAIRAPPPPMVPPNFSAPTYINAAVGPRGPAMFYPPTFTSANTSIPFGTPTYYCSA